MEVYHENEDNFPFDLNALLLAIEEIEGTRCKNEHMESNNLSCNTHEKSPFNYSETVSTKSPAENKSNNDNSVENGKPTEDISFFGLQALLVAIEEVEGIQPNNEHVQSNNLSEKTHKVNSCFICPDFSSVDSSTENKASLYPPSDLDTFYGPPLKPENKVSPAYTFSNTPLTLPIQSSNQENETYFNPSDLSEKSDISPAFKNEISLNQLCSECGEIVELLNDDPTFSLEVHLQSHKVTNESSDLSPELIYDKDVDYMCPDCNMSISVFNNDIDFSLERHYSNCQPRDMSKIPEKRMELNNFTDAVFFCLGDAFKTHYSYFIFDGSELYCRVCKCGIATSENIVKTSVSLRAHLSSLYHNDLVSVFDEPEEPAVDLSKNSSNSQCHYENQKGKLPRERSVIPSNRMSCESGIQISNENYKETLEFTHITKSTIPEKRIQLDKFTIAVFFCLGDTFKTHYSYIIFDGSELSCRVCKCGIATSENIVKTSVSLRAHLSSLCHKDLVSVLDEAKEPPVDLSKIWSNPQCHYENQKGELPRERIVIPSNRMSWESRLQISKEDYKETLEFTHITKFISEKYNIHSKFFSLSKEGIYCNICSHYVANMHNLTSHIITISHKIAFFKQIKENMPNEQKSQVKCLIIVGEKLICTSCKDEITLLDNFDSVCTEILKHFQNSSHNQRGP